jgi:isopentenyl-diphosphate delta-isomerase
MTDVTPDYEEVLDLVDANDQVVGTVMHDQIYDGQNLGGNYLRASHVFIVNSEGKVWIPTRQATKKISPNGLDYSAAEHVASGESYEEAAVRGTAEELGLDITIDDLTFAFSAPPSPNVPYFNATFLYYSDDVPEYSRDDYQSWEWLSPQELLDKLESGIPAKKSLLPAAKLLSDYLTQHKRDQ